MSDPINLNSSEIAELFLGNPRLANRLLDCSKIQPELDPQAGFGAMQPFAIWKTYGFTEDCTTDLLLTTTSNPYKLYVVLRAMSLLFTDPDKLCAALEVGEPIPYEEMLEYIKRICNSFNADLARLHITEVTSANTPKSVKQGKQGRRKPTGSVEGCDHRPKAKNKRSRGFRGK